MATKSNKKALQDQYRAILEKDGVRYEDCRVLAFVFERPMGPETFHLHVLNAEPRPKYHLFDCFDLMAQVIISNDDKIAARVEELAIEVGGKKTSPILR